MDLDWLAKQALEVLRGSGADDGYIAEKRSELEGKDRLQVLRWLACFDAANLRALEVRLEIPAGALRTTVREVLPRL